MTSHDSRSCSTSQFYKGKTVLVTGGAGAIGSNLVKALCSAGVTRVIILDDLSSSREWNVPAGGNILFVRGSVVDEIDLKRVFGEKPDLVFHLAAFFANQNSVDYPERDLEVNGLGALRMLEYSRMIGVERFVFASSGCSVYGSSAPLPLREDFVSLSLSTPYQITKMLGELYGNFFHAHYELPVVQARFFNSYGPGEIPGQYRNVIPNFIYWAMQGLPLPITGNAHATRDFTYVEDLVEGLLLLGQESSAIGQAFNLAGGREIQIGYLAELINTLTGNAGGIRVTQARKWDTKPRILASIEKAEAQVGYRPDTLFEEGLEKTVAWFHEHWHQIISDADFPPGVSSAVRDQPNTDSGKHHLQ